MNNRLLTPLDFKTSRFTGGEAPEPKMTSSSSSKVSRPKKEKSVSSMSAKPTLRMEDYDPEDMHFGDHDGTSASLKTKKKNNKNKKDSSMTDGREHYGDLPGKKSELGRKGKGLAGQEREDEMGVGKYAGAKASRKDIQMDKSSSESELDSGAFDPHLSFDDQESYPAPTNKLAAQLQRMQVEEEQSLQLISSRTSSDATRGQHVRSQYAVWGKVLDLRVQMQPLMVGAGRLPSASEVLAFDQDRREEVVRGLDGLIDGLLEMQEGLMDRDGIKRRKMASPSSETTDVNALWKRASRLEAALLPFCRSALEKWHQKAVLSSGETNKNSSSKKQLRVINQGVWQQVEMAMRDQGRLMARTQLLRCTSEPRIAEDCQDNNGTSQDRRVYPDIFDDTDFYQQSLLREWIESNPTASTSAISSGLAVTGVERGKAAAISATRVDQRASKGRKLRFDVHEKLVNYMVPMQDGMAVPWAQEKISELFASLLAN